METSLKAPKSARTVFIGGISLRSTYQELHDYLSQFGTIDTLTVPRDKNTKLLKGYAKALMRYPEDALKLTVQKYHHIGGLDVGINMWQAQGQYLQVKENCDHRKVYVKFKSGVAEDSIREHFRKFGPIEQLTLKFSALTNKSRNFCYILYYEESSARKATDQRFHTVDGVELICEMSRSTTDEHPVKKRMLERQIAATNKVTTELAPFFEETGTAVNTNSVANDATICGLTKKTNFMELPTTGTLEQNGQPDPNLQQLGYSTSFLGSANFASANFASANFASANFAPLLGSSNFAGPYSNVCKDINTNVSSASLPGLLDNEHPDFLHARRPTSKAYSDKSRIEMERRHKSGTSVVFKITMSEMRPLRNY